MYVAECTHANNGVCEWLSSHVGVLARAGKYRCETACVGGRGPCNVPNARPENYAGFVRDVIRAEYAQARGAMVSRVRTKYAGGIHVRWAPVFDEVLAVLGHLEHSGYVEWIGIGGSALSRETSKDLDVILRVRSGGQFLRWSQTEMPKLPREIGGMRVDYAVCASPPLLFPNLMLRARTLIVPASSVVPVASVEPGIGVVRDEGWAGSVALVHEALNGESAPEHASPAARRVRLTQYAQMAQNRRACEACDHQDGFEALGAERAETIVRCGLCSCAAKRVSLIYGTCPKSPPAFTVGVPNAL
jgi:hypothetical protein